MIVGGQAAGAHLVQGRLEHMGEADQGLQAEGAGAPLDGMHRAEHGVDAFRIVVALLDRQQAVLEFGELFLAFLEERISNGG